MEIIYNTGDRVIIKEPDHFAGIRGIIAQESINNHSCTCYILKLTDSEEFEKKYGGKVGNHTKEAMEKRRLVVAHYNLESDNWYYREQRIKKLLKE